jgi:hypothetical protein
MIRDSSFRRQQTLIDSGVSNACIQGENRADYLAPISQISAADEQDRLICDLKDFDFLHSEVRPTRQKWRRGDPRVVQVNHPKPVSETVHACVAVIVNSNVTNVSTAYAKASTSRGNRMDRVVLPFGS